MSKGVCPECDNPMDKATGVDCDKAEWVCPVCAEPWVYEMATTTYESVEDIPFF